MLVPKYAHTCVAPTMGSVRAFHFEGSCNVRGKMCFSCGDSYYPTCIFDWYIAKFIIKNNH